MNIYYVLKNEQDGGMAGNKNIRPNFCLQVATGYIGKQRHAVLKLKNKCQMCYVDNKICKYKSKEKYRWPI